MPYKVGDVARYYHGSDWDQQLSLYHREHLNGKLALVLDVAHNQNVSEYFCYIDGSKVWVNGTLLYELGEENENEKKNS